MGRTLTGALRGARRFAAVVELTNAGMGSGEIARELGCTTDLVRHYRQLARSSGIEVRTDPHYKNQALLNDWKWRENKGNEKWKALGE